MQDEKESIGPPMPAGVVDAPPDTPAAAPVPCGTLPECEEYRRNQDKGYSLRRAFYVGLSTAFALLVSATLVFMHYDGPLATQYVTGLLNFAGTICIFYLGAGVVDRQRFLERLGDGFGRRRDGDGDGDRK